MNIVRYIPDGGSGGGSGPNPTDAFSIKIVAGDTNASPTDAFTALLNILQADSNLSPTELVNLKFPSGDFGDTNAVSTDTRLVTITSWATGCTDNDAGNTNPGNANNPPDGTFTKTSTNLALGDLTNPVHTDTGSLNYPAGLTNTNPRARLVFKITDSRAAALDTVKITYNDGAGHSGDLWTWGLAAEDHSGTNPPLIVPMNAATVLTSVVFSATYTASVVAVPQSANGIQVDAWAIMADTTL